MTGSSTGSSARPLVFYATKVLEIADDRLLLKIPGRLPSWLGLVLSAACAWAAPAVLFAMEENGAPFSWTTLVAIVGGFIVIWPWGSVPHLGLAWSRLAPAAGRVALRRIGAGAYSLQVGEASAEQSARRGLFALEHEGSINALVAVVGRRLVPLAYFIRSGVSGVSWAFGQWDQGRADLAAGVQAVEDPWPPRSVVPLVRAGLRVLNLGPQPKLEEQMGMQTKDGLVLAAMGLGLPALHLAVMICLDHFGNPLAKLGPIGGGLTIGGVLLIPDAFFYARHLKRFYIGPLNRIADEMLALSQ